MLRRDIFKAAGAGLLTLFLPKESKAEADVVDGLSVRELPSAQDILARLTKESKKLTC